MSLAAGTPFGAYEISGLLGAGGMGEVYRARDLRLKRDVALKVLPVGVAADSDRTARFQREAELLATLSHSNIAAIYGLETVDGHAGLVLELVEGETLAERLARAGALPLVEALDVARQIADALEAAHEKGIVHRDLKPANIKITPDGTVKVLDFGLAKLAEGHPAPQDAELTASPTLSVRATYAGVILGTAPYMSPEQARGRPVDRRTDIFAFGCVLYEMLTGRPAFAGDDVAAVLARVIEREPDWRVLPASVPPRVHELLRLCLEKDRKRRRQAAGDVRLDLEMALAEPAAAPASGVASGSQGARVSWAAAGVVVVAAIALTGAASWFLHTPTPPRVTRTIADDPAAPLTADGPSRDLSISADGTRIVYVGANNTRLVVRALDQLQSRVLADLGRPIHPIFSPDGQWIAFFDFTQALKKVPTAGGPAQTLTTLTGAPRGASWGPDDTIIFATLDPATGLLRIPSAGGKAEVLTTPDPSQGEEDHFWPEVLPGGNAVLFTVFPKGGLGEAQVAVLDLGTRERQVVLRGGSHAQYVAPGYLVYGVSGTLRAVRFDLTRRGVIGGPVPVVESLRSEPQGAIQASVSRDGTLVYVPQFASADARTLAWVDRQGREEPVNVPPRLYSAPRLSPDGTRLAVDFGPGITIFDLTRKTEMRLPPGGSDPVWSPDGRRLIWRSGGGVGGARLLWQASDGTGTPQELIEVRTVISTYTAAPDGERLVVRLDGVETGVDLAMFSLVGERTLVPLIRTPFDERNAEISPDGRFLAYESSESGQAEIYIRPFPNVMAGRWQVSTAGGRWPLWARSGRELFFRAFDGAVMGVPVDITGGSSVTVGIPTRLVRPGYLLGGAANREYDVSLDGTRFLMIRGGAGAGDATEQPHIVVVQNFVEELKRLVRAN